MNGQVEGEEPPTVMCMVCIDGNNSLKRLATAEGRRRGDARVFQSDYILPRDFVDQYANEVSSRQRQSKPDLPGDADDALDDTSQFPGVDNGGYPTDGVDNSSTPCASNWKAAAADETKKMWAIFDETGIFICVCRHGIILWIADMVRSGEL